MLYNCYGGKKNNLDTPLYHSLCLGGIHMHSPTFKNTMASLTKDVPSLSLPLSAIMKYFPPLHPRNLPILTNPSRTLTGSIVLKVTFYNMTRTSLLAYSLLPLPVLSYPSQPMSCDMFRPSHKEYQWQYIPLLPTPLCPWCTPSERHWIWPVLLHSPISTKNIADCWNFCNIPHHHWYR